MAHRVSAPPSRFSYCQLLRATARQRIPRPTLVADYLNDLYLFSPVSNMWTLLSAANQPPARDAMGIAATYDGMIYVFGGYAGSGGETAHSAARFMTLLGVFAMPSHGVTAVTSGRPLADGWKDW